jgi:septum formation protein
MNNPQKPQTSFVYLASQSPRRAELLGQLCVPYRKLTPLECGFKSGSQALQDELLRLEELERAQPGEGALDYVQRVTLSKFKAALALSDAHPSFEPQCPVLSADTTVAFGGEILGKPLCAQEAQDMLERLSAQTHEVFTSVVVGTRAGFEQRLSRSWVEFAPMSAKLIESYVQSSEWSGKAGGYAIQGRAASFISCIKGSYSGIMGLPLFETSELLRPFGLTP